MENKFTHLHLHTDYSNHDGICNISDLIKKAEQCNFEHLSITDHGTLAGAIKFYEECKKHNIKPIIGMEGYICNNLTVKSTENNRTHHITLLSQNNDGYQNLLRLNHIANKKGFYSKPRIDLSTLAEHKNGLIILSGCMIGELASNIIYLQDNNKTALNLAKTYKDIFGDNYFLEIMYQDFDHQEIEISEETKKVAQKQIEIIKGIKKISESLGIKTVITNDVHYVHNDEMIARNMKMKIHSMGGRENESSYESTNTLKDSLLYHLKTPDEMYHYWGNDIFFKKALVNTYEIGESCNIDLKLLTLGDKVESNLPKVLIPSIDIKENKYIDYLDNQESLTDEVKYVIDLSYRELEKRNLVNEIYLNRLKKEIGVVSCNPVFCQDFLIVRDYVDFAKKEDIYVGVGRGCFLPENKVLLSNGFCKEIRDIHPGDRVITADGKSNLVLNTFDYKCKENILNINHATGKLKLTLDHKVLAVHKNKPKLKKWIKASKLTKDHYLLFPRRKNDNEKDFYIDLVEYNEDNKNIEYDDINIWNKRFFKAQKHVSMKRKHLFDDKMATLIGTYIRRGFIKANDKTYILHFTFHKTEIEQLNVVIKYIKDLFGYDPTTFPYKKSITLSYNSKILAYFFKNYCGRYKRERFIQKEIILNGKTEYVKTLLSNLFYYKNRVNESKRQNKIIYRTTSRNLAYQIIYLLSQFDYFPSLVREDHINIYVNKTYFINIYNEFALKFMNEFNIFSENLKIKKFHKKYFIDDNYIYNRVKSLRYEKYDGLVYDLNVETEHSYVCENSIVHNSACGSLILYLLGITGIDPIKYNLNFDRFLSADEEFYTTENDYL